MCHDALVEIIQCTKFLFERLFIILTESFIRNSSRKNLTLLTIPFYRGSRSKIFVFSYFYAFNATDKFVLIFCLLQRLCLLAQSCSALTKYLVALAYCGILCLLYDCALCLLMQKQFRSKVLLGFIPRRSHWLSVADCNLHTLDLEFLFCIKCHIDSCVHLIILKFKMEWIVSA